MSPQTSEFTRVQIDKITVDRDSSSSREPRNLVFHSPLGKKSMSVRTNSLAKYQLGISCDSITNSYRPCAHCLLRSGQLIPGDYPQLLGKRAFGYPRDVHARRQPNEVASLEAVLLPAVRFHDVDFSFQQ